MGIPPLPPLAHVWRYTYRSDRITKVKSIWVRYAVQYTEHIWRCSVPCYFDTFPATFFRFSKCFGIDSQVFILWLKHEGRMLSFLTSLEKVYLYESCIQVTKQGQSVHCCLLSCMKFAFLYRCVHKHKGTGDRKQWKMAIHEVRGTVHLLCRPHSSTDFPVWSLYNIHQNPGLLPFKKIIPFNRSAFKFFDSVQRFSFKFWQRLSFKKIRSAFIL